MYNIHNIRLQYTSIMYIRMHASCQGHGITKSRLWQTPQQHYTTPVTWPTTYLLVKQRLRPQREQDNTMQVLCNGNAQYTSTGLPVIKSRHHNVRQPGLGVGCHSSVTMQFKDFPIQNNTFSATFQHSNNAMQEHFITTLLTGYEHIWTHITSTIQS